MKGWRAALKKLLIIVLCILVLVGVSGCQVLDGVFGGEEKAPYEPPTWGNKVVTATYTVKYRSSRIERMDEGTLALTVNMDFTNTSGATDYFDNLADYYLLENTEQDKKYYLRGYDSDVFVLVADGDTFNMDIAFEINSPISVFDLCFNVPVLTVSGDEGTDTLLISTEGQPTPSPNPDGTETLVKRLKPKDSLKGAPEPSAGAAVSSYIKKERFHDILFTQPENAVLTYVDGSLVMDIVEVESNEETAPTPSPSPSPSAQPSASEQPEQIGVNSTGMISIIDPVSVFGISDEEYVSNETYTKQLWSSLKEDYGASNYDTQNVIEVGGIPAIQFIYSYEKDGIPLKARSISFIYDGNLYEIHLASLTDYAARNNHTFNEFLDSVALSPEPAFPLVTYAPGTAAPGSTEGGSTIAVSGGTPEALDRIKSQLEGGLPVAVPLPEETQSATPTPTPIDDGVEVVPGTVREANHESVVVVP